MKRTLKACFSLFKLRAAEGLQYRLSALSGATISIFYALIEAVILTVFFTHSRTASGSVNGLSLGQAVSYAWIGQFLAPLHLTAIDNEILSKIVSGDIGIELCRPLDLYSHWFAKTAAGRINSFLLRSGLILIAGALIPGRYGMSAPDSLAGFLFFSISSVSALFLCTAFGMLLTAVRINVAWGDGPVSVIMVISSFLSGAELPLQLWPDFLQPFLVLQPFAGYLDIPTRLYVGSMPPSGALPGISLQLLWTAVLVLAGRAVLNRKLRSVVIQGG